MSVRALGLPTLLGALLLLHAGPAHAQAPTWYSDRAAFNTAVNASLNLATFNELTQGALSNSVSYPGITFHSTDGTTQDIMILGPKQVPTLTSNVLLSFRNFNPVVMELSPAVSAVGFEFYVFKGTAPVTVTVQGPGGSASQTLAVPASGHGFVGVTGAPGSITRVTLSNPPGAPQFVAVDDVAYGDVSIVDPVQAAFDGLEAALAAGQKDGTIRKLGTSLEDKLQTAQDALDAGDTDGARDALLSMEHEIRAQRGKQISTGRADQLMGLIDTLLSVL